MHDSRAAASLACGLAILLFPCLSCRASALSLSAPGAAAGQWDMSLGTTDRTCRMSLEQGAANGGRVDMPALCRRSLPILANVGAWTLAKAGDIELADASGKAVLDFVAKSQDELSANGPQGEIYDLVPVDSGKGADGFEVENTREAPGFAVVQATPPQPAASGPSSSPAEKHAPAKVAKSAPPPSAAALALKPGDAAGRYSLQRLPGKDASCLLILDAQAKAQGGNKAHLAPDCRDQGIMIFDPVGWRLAAGRLVLTARRGFTTRFDLLPNSTWQKDPSEGKPLYLKKQ